MRYEKYIKNLELILSRIDYYPTKLAKTLGWSKQKLNYWLKRFEKEGFIRSTPMGIYTQYFLTEKGQYVKKYIGELEYPITTPPTTPQTPPTTPQTTPPTIQTSLEDYIKEPLLDIHNFQVVIPITEKGRLPEGKIRMKNWTYSHIQISDYHINVNYGKEPTFVINVPKQKGNSLHEIGIKIGMKTYQILSLAQQKYGCDFDLSRMRVTKKPHIHAFKDPITRELAKRIKYSGINLEVNESGGSHMDLTGWEAAVKYDKLINDVPQEIEFISNRLDRIERSMDKFAIAMDQHVKLIKSIQKLVDELREIRKNSDS